ncbi:hypothetical protein PVE_R2G0627 [Pseudomonas veronii 1YdBTEX2]|uniref:Uncharacterized protein n=1 Tax=Pseudomonas veronii 1YdBTEX2 TaxID=1295141 RepID=A0A1D3K8F2_PSEVE|nr:hypothetical protein PVE_R2G0627 [Pseudomonas veronii 1YdBTEX2]
MQTYNVDVGYLQEEDAFEVNHLLPNWVPSSNIFLERSVSLAKVGASGSLSQLDFNLWLSDLALSLPAHTGVALDLVLTESEGVTQVNYSLVDLIPNIDPPIEADNPGFLNYALTWFRSRRPHVRIYAAEGLFWMEGV